MAETADPVTVPVELFLAIGIGARTTNAREMSGEGAIGPLWARLMKYNLLERIPNRVDNRIIAVYSDYANGKDGEYNYLLGARVSSVKHVPDGMAARHIVPGDYAMFTAKGRHPAEMVVGIWKQIWSLETGKKLARAYRTDFEVYSNGANPPDTLVDVYIGLRARS
jgi:predicted transcriptional regulator YdeE